MIRKKILVLMMILMFVMSASIALGAIKDEAKRTGYHNPLFGNYVEASSGDYIHVANNLLINSGNRLIVAGDTLLNNDLEVRGEAEFDSVLIDGDVRVKDSSYEIQSSNTNGGGARGLHLYDDDSRLGSIGYHMSGEDLDRVYLSSTGDEPWNNGELMLKNGKVGIGTTNPSTTLDVDGSISSDEISSDEYCIESDCITAWNDVGGGSSLWSTSGDDIYYDEGNVHMNNIVLFDGKISTFELTNQDIIDESTTVATGTFKSGPPGVSSPHTSFDFEENLVPDPIPEGNVEDENYYVRVTSGYDAGKIVELKQTSDGSSWNSKDYFSVSSPGVQMMEGDEFEVLLYDGISSESGSAPLVLDGDVNINNNLDVNNNINAGGDLSMNGDIEGVKNIRGSGLDLSHTIKKIASNNLRHSHNYEESSTSRTREVVKRITFPNGLLGQIRIKFDMKFESPSSATGCDGVAVLYKGDTELKEQRSNPGEGYETVEKDYTGTFNPSDSLHIETGMSSICSSGEVFVKNFRIYYDDDPGTKVASQNS